MKTITATELARNLRQVLDNLAVQGEEVAIERNHQQIARLVPGGRFMTALEAMADIYKTLPEPAARGWEKAGRARTGEKPGSRGVRDPWAS